MLRLHHVNLGVPVDGVGAEATFLIEVLGYRSITEHVPPNAHWFGGDDGTQIHLSEDPDHRPAARAHVAIELGDGLAMIESKLDGAGYKYTSIEGEERRIAFCQDPAGNRWELRGPTK